LPATALTKQLLHAQLLQLFADMSLLVALSSCKTAAAATLVQCTVHELQTAGTARHPPPTTAAGDRQREHHTGLLENTSQRPKVVFQTIPAVLGHAVHWWHCVV
jgi:hypothetical protein